MANKHGEAIYPRLTKVIDELKNSKYLLWSFQLLIFIYRQQKENKPGLNNFIFLS